MLSALIHCISRDSLGGNVQGAGFSHAPQNCVLVVDGPGVLPLLLCCRSMVAKVIK